MVASMIAYLLLDSAKIQSSQPELGYCLSSWKNGWLHRLLKLSQRFWLIG
jgi:hypothetical protein